MFRRLFCASISLWLCASTPAMAQDYSGFSDAAAALMGRKERADEVYRDRLFENLATYAAMERARSARDEAVVAEIQAGAQIQLKQYWMEIGLSEEQASTTAASYEFKAEQLAHNMRAMQDGVGPTVRAAVAAYRERNYQLANQLLLAATRKDVPQVK